MAEADLGFAARTNVAQFPFEAFHFKPYGRAAEEGEGHESRRRVGLFEADGEQIERPCPILLVQTDLSDFQDPVETESRADPLVPPARRRTPIVSHGGQNEPPLARQIS